MSLTKRTFSDVAGAHTFVVNGSVSGANTSISSIVFTADSWINGLTGTIYVYVDGTRKTVSWTTNKSETAFGTTYKVKMTSGAISVSKPFFTLKLVNSATSSTLIEEEFSFYEIEKTPKSATTSGGVMDGSTKSKVVFTTSGTDASYSATFTLGSYSGAASSSTKTIEYAIPIAWCNALPNTVTGQANVACQVKYGGVVYSSFTVKLAVSVPSGVVPAVTSVTLADKAGTPVPSSWNMFIQHKSGVRVSAVATAGAYSSTIKTIKLQVGTQSISQNYSASSLPQIDTITQSGSLSCKVTVTDSRGRTASKTATVTFAPYAAPKFTNCVSERCLANGEVDNDGTYFKSTTAVSFSTCNNKNTITLTVKYKKTDAVVYGSETTISPGVNTCGNDDLDTEFSYDVMYSVSDQFCTVTYTDYISTAVYLMHFLHGGKGVAFGQKATMEDYLDCAFKALFRDDAYFVTGNGVQVNIRDIITIGAQTLTSLENGQFLYANNGKIGSRTIGLANTTDGVYKAGDSVTIGGTVWGYGALASSSADMYLVVPLGKMITASSATLTSGTMTVRTVAGYAYNKASASGGTYSNLDISQFSPVVTLNKPTGTIRIQVTNPTKWVNSAGTVIANNTPVTAALYITVQFA